METVIFEKLNLMRVKIFSDYYRANFKTIYDFAKTSNSKLSTVDNCVRFANMGRLILESHARSNYRLEYATSSAITQLMKFYNISEEKEEEFKGMLDVINRIVTKIQSLLKFYYHQLIQSLQLHDFLS